MSRKPPPARQAAPRRKNGQFAATGKAGNGTAPNRPTQRRKKARASRKARRKLADPGKDRKAWHPDRQGLRDKFQGPGRASMATSEGTRAYWAYEALKLKRAGLHYRDVTEEINRRGYGCTLPTVYYLVQEALAELDDATKKLAPRVREQELATLDQAQAHLWPRVQRGEPAAVQALIRISERRARLTGMDQPVKVAPTDPGGTRPYGDMTDEALERMLAAVGQRLLQPGGDAGTGGNT